MVWCQNSSLYLATTQGEYCSVRVTGLVEYQVVCPVLIALADISKGKLENSLSRRIINELHIGI